MKPMVRMMVSSACLNCVKSVEEDWIQETFFFKFLFLLFKILNRTARLTIVLAHLRFLPSAFLSSGLLFPVSQCSPYSNNPGEKVECASLYSINFHFCRRTSRANWVTTENGIKMSVG